MADFRLTQTGQQVQDDLNNAEQDNVTLEQHVANGNIHVTNENKETWNSKYNKPSGGIPKSDLAEAVQAAVNAALTAYQKPVTGIPKSDLASAVQTAIDAALTAYQKPGAGIPKTDLAAAVQSALDAALTAYQKPNTGIPQSDMSADVQSKLNAAGSADAAIAAERLARETADLAINEALGTKVNATQVSNAIAAALADYDTSAEVASAISTAISTALANYYTKAQTYSQSEVDALIANFVTASVNNLVNYYLKSDTYTKAEVQALIDAVKQFVYVSVAELPTASSDTMNKIYLVPSTNPKTKNAKDEFITIAVTDQGTTTYSWEQIGSTTIDLSNYYTITQTDAAINAALASYSTTSQMNTAIATALADYYTKSQTYSKTEVDALLSPKQTQAQVEAIVANALASYSTTAEVSAAIASALTDYYTKTAIDAALAGKQATLQFDLTPTLNSSNPVTSEGIRAAIAAAVNGLVNSSYVQNAITTALADYSTTSQIGTMISTAITTALAAYYNKTEIDSQMAQKQNTLTFDNTPVENSNNPVKSGGLYTELASKMPKFTDLASIGLGTGVCSTAATTAAKTATISNFILFNNGIVSIRFTNAVAVPSATLNISGTGAKPIYIGGIALQPGMIRPGMTAVMQYDGTNWNIIALQGLENSQSPSDLYVDMGLPSGLLWARKNIDITQANGFAASEYQYECSFFSWGNTQGHNPADASSFSYDWGTGIDGPYASTPGAALNGNASPSFDFARANCGAPWRLPTTEEFAELFNNIDYANPDGSLIDSAQTNKLVTIESIVGIYLKSKNNGNFLFFPCSGLGNGASWGGRGSYGYYWSSSLCSAANGRSLGFNAGGVYPQNYYHDRFYGFAGRAVQ